MSISIIVAADRNGVIGRAGGLPWRLRDDMAFFKTTTTGHTVIMGRKTYEAVGRPLPNRRNIVISRNPNYQAEGCETASSLPEAIALAKADEVFIIGGSSVFNEALHLARRVYLTKVQAEVQGDTYFNFNPVGWHQTKTEHHAANDRNEYSFDITLWERDAPLPSEQ